MKISEIVSILPSLIDDPRLNFFLWGPPGIGKSDAIKLIAKATGRPLVDIRAVLLDPVDLRGIPYVKDGTASWCPPAFLPMDRESNAIVFMDELPQAAPLVQAACLQLVLDRRIGEYVLPEGCSIIAAGNRQEDAAGAHRLISPLRNRFCHFTMDVSNEDWRNWALANGIDGRILAFLAFKPDMLFAFDPKSADNSFPTPRSWEFTSRAITGIGTSAGMRVVRSLVDGCVGSGAAAEFCAFLEHYEKLPNLDDVFADPSNHAIPDKEPSVMYALCGALAARLREDKNLGEAYTKYATRFPSEFGVVAMKDGIQIDPTLITRTKEGANWATANSELILGA